MNISYESKLKCFYLNTTLRPYLRLTRVRVEELYKRPQIVLIHNFLSETEAQIVKNYSIPDLTLGGVVNGNNEAVLDPNRVAYQSTFNEYSDYKTFININRRFGEITGNYSKSISFL